MQKLKNTSKHGKKLNTCSVNYLVQKECINHELCIHMMVQPIIVGPTIVVHILFLDYGLLVDRVAIYTLWFLNYLKKQLLILGFILYKILRMLFYHSSASHFK